MGSTTNWKIIRLDTGEIVHSFVADSLLEAQNIASNFYHLAKGYLNFPMQLTIE